MSRLPVVYGDNNAWGGELNKAIPNVTNVLGFGAIGDGVSDDTAAIVAAYADIPSTGGVLYFPAGTYKFSSALSLTNSKPVSLLGGGPTSSILAPSFAAGDAIVANGPSLFSAAQLGIVPSVNRSPGTYNLAVSNCTRPMLDMVYVNNGAGGLFKFDTCNFVQMSNCQGDTSSGVPGTAFGTCLRIKAAGGAFSNVTFRTAGGAPSLWISGVGTSLNISNSSFSGGGPHSSWVVSSITSTGANFTVTTTLPHDFQAGDFVVLRGNTPTAYNDVWRIASVGATTFVVTSALNPGTATIKGTAESLSACGLVSNEDGAFNEAVISNCLFEAITPNTPGTVGLYLDGRRGTAGARGTLSGWRLDNNYYDYGNTGLLLSGTAGDGSNSPTVHGVNVVGGCGASATRGIHIDQANNITVSAALPTPSAAILTDNISPACALYVYAGAATPKTAGINVNGSNLGQARNYFNGTPYSYGIILDSPGIQDLTVENCQVFGAVLPVGEINTPLAAAQRWRFKGNTANWGTWPPTNTNLIPSIASANGLTTNPYHEVQKVTGTTNIQSIDTGWIGKELTLLFTGALSLITGGNLAIGANRTVLAGDVITFVHDGTSWYVR